MNDRMPLSGGEYNWVAILAPKNLSNFLSYITGWGATFLILIHRTIH